MSLVPFVLNAVVTANIYLPICVFRGWPSRYKKQIQLRAVCFTHVLILRKPVLPNLRIIAVVLKTFSVVMIYELCIIRELYQNPDM